MLVTNDLTPIAKTSDDSYVFYKKNGDFDGVFRLNDEEISISLADFFAKRTDITPIEDTPQTKKIWADLRRQMGVSNISDGDMFVKIAKRPDKFDPDAVDADNDGRVQDGTPFERPTTATNSARFVRRLRMSGPDKRTSTDVESDEFKAARQAAFVRAKARGESLKKVSRRVFAGRQRPASQRRRLLDGSALVEYPGIRRLFKNRDDAYSDLKESVIRTVEDMRQRAIAGQLRGRRGRPVDPRVVDYFKRNSAEKIWEDLETAAIKLRDAVDKMPIESRVHVDNVENIVTSGLLGDPQNRTKREDLKTPWIIGVLSDIGHTLSDEDKRMLDMNGLSARETGRGDIYESVREILEQAMGFNGAGDRNGRPVYGYFVTPSPRSTEEIGDLTEVGQRLLDQSNGPNLPGYSDTALVRMRPSVKDRTGFSYGDSLRNGIIPSRIGDGNDQDTVLAVVHDTDFTDMKVPLGVESENRENQEDYMLGLLEWRLMGDSSSLTRQDYIEAVVPHDVSPDEIEEVVISTSNAKVFLKDFDSVEKQIVAMARGMKQENYDNLLMFLLSQKTEWTKIVNDFQGPKTESEVAQFANLDPYLRKVLQAVRGQQLRRAGEEKGIRMIVGPSRRSEPQTVEEAIEALIRRFNP